MTKHDLLKEFEHLYQSGIRAEAERRFGLAGISPTPLTGSHSLVFDYPKDGTRRILKITHSTHRRVHQILGELDFTNYLSDHGMNVSHAVESLSGRMVEQIEAESGHFVAVVYEKAPGKLVDWSEWTPELFAQWGSVIGRMHTLTKGYEPSAESIRRRHWYEDRDWDIESSIPPDKAQLAIAGKRIKDWLLELPMDRESFGLVHSDLHQWNMLFDGVTLWPIDFDNLHYDWLIADFTTVIINVAICQARSYELGDFDHWTGGREMTSPEFVGYFLEPFLAGYREQNTLDSVWIRRLPAFLRRHWFTFCVDNLWDPTVRGLSDAEQAAGFPWRTVDRMEIEFVSEFWGQFDFSRFE